MPQSKPKPKKKTKPNLTKSGMGVLSKYGVLGYGIQRRDGTPLQFIPIVFCNEGRAKGMARTMQNRTTIEAAVTPVFCHHALEVTAFMHTGDVRPDTIPTEGRASRRIQTVISRKRVKAAKAQRIEEFNKL